MRRSPRSIARPAGILVALVALGACSDGSAGVSQLDARATEDQPFAAVETLSVRLDAQFGDGRAVAAHQTDVGLVVVTTSGVGIVDDEGVEMIDTFEAGAEPGLSTVSPDGTELAVWTQSPSAIHWYSLTTRRRIGTELVPAGSFVRELVLGVGDDTATLASTGDGLFLWRDADRLPPESVLAGAVAAGSGALTDAGQFVVAIAGSSDLAVIGNGEPQRIPIPTGAPRDVAASGEGTTIGVVTSTDDPQDLEGSDSILVLDAVSFEVLGEILTDRRLEPTTWALTDDVVVVAGVSTATVHTIDGSTTIDLMPLHEQPIVEILATSSRVIGIDRRGGISVSESDTGVGTMIDEGGISLTDVSLDEASGVVVTTDFYGRIRAWDLGSGTAAIDELAFESGAVTSVAVGPDGDRIGVASTDGTVTMLDPALEATATVAVGDHPVRVDAVEFVPSTGELVTGLAERVGDLAFDDTVTVWDGDGARFRIGGEAEDVGGCAFFYNRIRFSPDSDLLAVTSHDFSTALVDARTGSIVHQFPPEPGAILDIAFTPDGTHLVVTNDAAMVTVWNVAERDVAAQYPAAMGGYQALAMLPGTPATMATVDIAGSVVVVDVLTGEQIRTFDGNAARTTQLAISPDGELLAAPSGPSGLVVWSIATGAVLADVPAHHGTVTDLAFTTDGAALLTASGDGTVRRWQLVRNA